MINEYTKILQQHQYKTTGSTSKQATTTLQGQRKQNTQITISNLCIRRGLVGSVLA